MGDKMRKVGLFVLGMLVCLNTSIAWASGECENLLTYVSCVVTYYYFHPDIPTSTVQEICNPIMPGLPNDFFNLALNYGEALKYDIESGYENAKYDNIRSLVAALRTYYGFCYELDAAMGSKYYVDLRIDIDTSNGVLYHFTFQECPAGGETDTDGNHYYDIRDCYISNFSDTTGSGEYVGGCHYSK